MWAIDPNAPGVDWVAEQARAFAVAGGELWLDAECVGLYPNDTGLAGNALLAVRRGDGLVALVADRVIVANGGASQPLPFPGVDRPGVYAARGLLALQAQCGVRVGEKLALVGDGKELIDCARALLRAGYSFARIVALSAERPEAPDLSVLQGAVRRALGNPVRALELEGGERVRCDAVALATNPAPLHELASSAGAKARWVAEVNGFPLEVDFTTGQTTVPWIFAAGRVAGLGGASAAPSGEAAGKGAAAP
jgi:sarcosine oxidase subunit alpha